MPAFLPPLFLFTSAFPSCNDSRLHPGTVRLPRGRPFLAALGPLFACTPPPSAPSSVLDSGSWLASSPTIVFLHNLPYYCLSGGFIAAGSLVVPPSLRAFHPLSDRPIGFACGSRFPSHFSFLSRVSALPLYLPPASSTCFHLHVALAPRLRCFVLASCFFSVFCRLVSFEVIFHFSCASRLPSSPLNGSSPCLPFDCFVLGIFPLALPPPLFLSLRLQPLLFYARPAHGCLLLSVYDLLRFAVPLSSDPRVSPSPRDALSVPPSAALLPPTVVVGYCRFVARQGVHAALFFLSCLSL